MKFKKMTAATLAAIMTFSTMSTMVSADISNNPDDGLSVVEVQLKDVDSTNGLEGDELDSALFNNSDLNWEDVEKVEFTSTNAFSLQFSTWEEKAGVSWFIKGSNSDMETDKMWNTSWTLDKNDFMIFRETHPHVKMLSKSGTIDITAKIYYDELQSHIVSEHDIPNTETFKIHEDSKYEITVENTVVDGKEMAAVRLSGLPKKMLTAKYDYKKQTGYSIFERELNSLKVMIDVGDSFLTFKTNSPQNDFECWYGKLLTEEELQHRDIWSEKYGYLITTDNYESYEKCNSSMKDDGDTFSLEAYFELENDLLNDLITYDKTTVLNWSKLSYTGGSTGGGVIGYSGGSYWGHISSEGKITLYEQPTNRAPAYFYEGEKERVKITNNLNSNTESKPETSDPTESTVTPGGTDPATKPGGSDKPAEQEILEVTLKNVDSKNGIEGKALDKLLFGDSGWTWDQVEKVEFSSENLFSVQYKSDSGDLVKLGEEVAARAAADGIWNTAWTLNASEMAKDNKYAKVIAKDGTIDVTAKVYIKKDAEKPSDGNSGSDQQPTGIALAIAPIVLAASAATVFVKKKK